MTKQEYYEQLYVNKLGNIEEMDRFIEKCKISKLTQKEIDNLNRPITSEETELVIKKLTKKSLGGFTTEFY